MFKKNSIILVILSSITIAFSAFAPPDFEEYPFYEDENEEWIAIARDRWIDHWWNATVGNYPEVYGCVTDPLNENEIPPSEANQANYINQVMSLSRLSATTGAATGAGSWTLADDPSGTKSWIWGSRLFLEEQDFDGGIPLHGTDPDDDDYHNALYSATDFWFDYDFCFSPRVGFTTGLGDWRNSLGVNEDPWTHQQEWSCRNFIGPYDGNVVGAAWPYDTGDDHWTDWHDEVLQGFTTIVDNSQLLRTICAHRNAYNAEAYKDFVFPFFGEGRKFWVDDRAYSGRYWCKKQGVTPGSIIEIGIDGTSGTPNHRAIFFALTLEGNIDTADPQNGNYEAIYYNGDFVVTSCLLRQCTQYAIDHWGPEENPSDPEKFNMFMAGQINWKHLRSFLLEYVFNGSQITSLRFIQPNSSHESAK
ncbi:MAG: hypothetical protein P9L92_06930 [Candidatus Electryonea clarkiae]|nr:hypothetical protein [Candidatus Electryonea clarkiae]MDP8287992.1 hypothetical protein [Candidatus Electryonea clarkiae]